jgi:hypothetical protein
VSWVALAGLIADRVQQNHWARAKIDAKRYIADTLTRTPTLRCIAAPICPLTVEISTPIETKIRGKIR